MEFQGKPIAFYRCIVDNIFIKLPGLKKWLLSCKIGGWPISHDGYCTSENPIELSAPVLARRYHWQSDAKRWKFTCNHHLLSIPWPNRCITTIDDNVFKNHWRSNLDLDTWQWITSFLVKDNETKKTIGLRMIQTALSPLPSVERRRRSKNDTRICNHWWKCHLEGSGRVIQSNYFFLDVSVRFRIDRPLRSRLRGYRAIQVLRVCRSKPSALCDSQQQ